MRILQSEKIGDITLYYEEFYFGRFKFNNPKLVLLKNTANNEVFSVLQVETESQIEQLETELGNNGNIENTILLVVDGWESKIFGKTIEGQELLDFIKIIKNHFRIDS